MMNEIKTSKCVFFREKENEVCPIFHTTECDEGRGCDIYNTKGGVKLSQQERNIIKSFYRIEQFLSSYNDSVNIAAILASSLYKKGENNEKS
jgi:hypothetical protein